MRERAHRRTPIQPLSRATKSIGSSQNKCAGDVTGIGIGDGTAIGAGAAGIGAGAVGSGVGIITIIGAGVIATGTAIGGTGDRFTGQPSFLF